VIYVYVQVHDNVHLLFHNEKSLQVREVSTNLILCLGLAFRIKIVSLVHLKRHLVFGL
jgi:hypothetical protein